MSQYGAVFDLAKIQFGKIVNFLDIIVDISDGTLQTDIYIKPTDLPNLLNRALLLQPIYSKVYRTRNTVEQP